MTKISEKQAKAKLIAKKKSSSQTKKAEGGYKFITSDQNELTVQYWRNKYEVLYPLFNNLIRLSDELGTIDREFAGAAGFIRMKNIHAGRAGLRITAKVVGLMEQLSPQPVVSTPSFLRRQGIHKAKR